MKYPKLLFAATVLLLMGICQISFADNQSKRVRDVTGRCEITRHITLEQAEQSRMTTMQVDGFISIREVTYSEVEENGRRYAVATIDADVKRGGEIDPTFVLDINGVDGIYANGSELKFKAQIYGHDAYMHLFWFDETGGSVIFPSKYEKKRLFIKETEYTFPVNQHMQYLMEKIDEDHEYETINLIAVATKRDIPFIEEKITFESLLKWIYAIPADERAAWREAVVIK